MTTLERRMDEDPFNYFADQGAIVEGQFARGYASDVYAYGGYSLANGEYTFERNNGQVDFNGEYSTAEIYGEAQLTEHITAEGEGRLLYAETEVTASWNEGFDISGEIGAAKIEGDITVPRFTLDLW